MRQGHPLALYCYQTPAGVPRGVEVRNAAEIIPSERVFRHRSGSFAPFSDWFRLELQRRELGTWLDTDIYLLRPLDSSRDYLFGMESAEVANNAVLRLPGDSRLLTALLEPFERSATPPWLPLRAYVAGRARDLVRGGADMSRLPWGTTGPHGLTVLARQLGLLAQALPADVFYPVNWQRADWIIDPSVSLGSVITERTVCVHLWNECIKEFKDEAAPEGSFLHRLHSEGALPD